MRFQCRQYPPSGVFAACSILRGRVKPSSARMMEIRQKHCPAGRRTAIRSLNPIPAWKPFILLVLLSAAGPGETCFASSAGLRLNEQGYFEMPGLEVLVFSNSYPEGKQGGVEIILHGERVAANGDLRIGETPGQWGLLPEVLERKNEDGHALVFMKYRDIPLEYSITVSPETGGFRLSVDLKQTLPKEWEGRLGLNLELFPGSYFGKGWIADSRTGIFPRQSNGPVLLEDGKRKVLPLARGRMLSIAPEDSLYRFSVENPESDIALFDGRDTDQNGWFVLRSLVPAGRTGCAVEWIVRARPFADWIREPVLLHSQVGYHPDARKRVWIECDPDDRTGGIAELLRTNQDGTAVTVRSGKPEAWGCFLRYRYAYFDFSETHEPGLYQIRYDGRCTPVFRIARDLYANGVWQPTLETYFPVQMCHMAVNDRFRVWHGACHMDDALQAPPGHVHFDGYRQGPDTETGYAPYSHIPGLNRGGWHDAGDDDLAGGAQARTIFTLCMIQEIFHIDADQISVHPQWHLVELHRPDGVPDVLQQIGHGLEALLSGYRNAGHCFPGIISSTLEQYVHVGDPATYTDNRIFEISGDSIPRPAYLRPGMDDRWVFTNRSTGLEYLAARTLAAASRVLRMGNPGLAEECLRTALRVWVYEQDHAPSQIPNAYVPRNEKAEEILAAVELFLTTQDDAFFIRLREMLPDIRKEISSVGWSVARILVMIDDEAFAGAVRDAVLEDQKRIGEEVSKNPFGVPFNPRVWGIGWNIQEFAFRQFLLLRVFPEIVRRETILDVVDYVLGCHPGSSTSLVSGVGARSMTVAYGFNRDDWSYIPGGMVSGTALIRPDFPELKEPFPFLWQQSEYVMNGAADYIFCILAADWILNQ